MDKPGDVLPPRGRIEQRTKISGGTQSDVPNFRELWQYRDLICLLVWRDVSTRYRQTILGPIWFLA